MVKVQEVKVTVLSISLVTVITLFSLQTTASLIVLPLVFLSSLLLSQHLRLPSGTEAYVLFAVFLVTLVGFLNFNARGSDYYYFFLELIIFIWALMWSRAQPLALVASYKVCFYLGAGVLSVLIILNLENPQPLEDAIPGVSTNGLTSILIVSFVAWSITQLGAGKTLPLGSSLWLLVISFFGVGRGSLIVSAILAIICAFHKFLKFSHLRKIFLLPFLLVISASLAGLFFDLYTYIVNNTKLTVGLSDSPRLNILREYFAGMGLLEVITGAGYEGTIIESNYMNNPHIAYVRAHSIFGIFYLLIVVALPLVGFMLRLSPADRFFAFCLLFAANLRAVSEPVLYPTALDAMLLLPIIALLRLRQPAPPIN